MDEIRTITVAMADEETKLLKVRTDDAAESCLERQVRP